jgi:hypothetical protein
LKKLLRSLLRLKVKLLLLQKVRPPLPLLLRAKQKLSNTF